MLNIEKNRNAVKYTKKQQALRVAWMVVGVLFRFSPRVFFAWRSFLLRLFGATVGKNVHIYNSSKIYMPWNLEIGDWSSIGEDVLIYNLGQINIGKNATISHRAHLCAGTHDYRKTDLPLLKLPITIEDQVWICASSFVGPNVSIGSGAIVGACAVVMKDVEAWSIVAGNPAKVVGKRVLD